MVTSNSAVHNKSVAILGAGPGGLTLARLLQMQGAEVKVYERDASRFARVQGATLNLNEESGLKALRRAHVMDAFEAAYRPGAEKLVIVDPAGKVLLDEVGGGDLQEERPEIDRGPLRELLLNSLQADTVVWDRQFVALQRSESSVRLEFQDGQSAVADIVVAADGANSKVRPYLTSIKPIYSGVMVVEGVVPDVATALPRLYQLLDGGKVCVLGDEKTLFIILKGDGSVTFYTGHKVDEFWARNSGIDFSDKGQVMNWFKREFDGWDEMWSDLLEQSTVFIPRPQYYMPLTEVWEPLPNLTLLGDAAHVMPPYAGEGVNMAMLDALELAECLLSEQFSDTRAAIAAYETKMRARAAEVSEETLKFTDIFHSLDAASYFVEFFKHPN